MEDAVGVGARVLVQFGRKKYYTGIVESLSPYAPEGFEVKPVMAVLDRHPAVRYPQLKFWNWIADYYLCSIGEVFKAAVPTGMKVESETYIAINPDYENPEGRPLSEREAPVVQLLTAKGPMRISDLEEQTGLRRLGAVITTMLEEGIVEIDEKLIEKYRPKKETCLRLTAERDDHEALNGFMDKVKRSPKGERALLAYLDRSRWLARKEPVVEVTKKEMIERVGISSAVIKSLIDKGIFQLYTREVNRFKSDLDAPTAALASFSPAQKKAFEEILSAFRDHQVCLLHGVTGSGKTEIYTHLIERVLAKGDQVLYLVPEISLTTQLTDRLRKVFGNRLLVYHSKFSDAERVDIYKRLLSTNEPLLVLGVRSSVFLPFARLGLVIVDEEHESSFKQYDPAPRYNARDAAIVLASMHGANTLLGSATPSVETYFKSQTGKYGLVTLTERFEGAVLPEVEIVDMRDQRKRKRNSGSLSEPLMEAADKALGEKRQVIMFQNRRGFAPMVICHECGWTPKCCNCDVSLVYHKGIDRLTCHYCGFSAPLPSLCPSCGQNSVQTFGYGTERIAEELHKRFEGYRVARMDLDTTRNKNAYQEIIEEFARHETDILVGTQMVTKGLDFEKVNLVGVINADTLLNFPDFRSDERAFNMLVQVAGRAGRRKEKGLVLIQTSDPDHDVLKFVKTHDYNGFYTHELEQRRRFNYPPFTRVINIYLKNKDRATVDSVAVAYTQKLREVFGARVLGPEQPPVGRISTYYLQTIMLKVEANASMRKVKELLRSVYATMASDHRMKSTQLYYDVDPV